MRSQPSKMKSLTAASSRFEAARQINTLPAGHRSSRLHGHGFVVTAYGSVPAAHAAYQGSDVETLQGQLDRCTGLLDYGLLNEQIERPTDEALARWILHRLDASDIERVAVQSTTNQGVTVDKGGCAQLWRRYRFQAAHRLPYVPIGHKCGRMHGHGFEVIVHATQNVVGSDMKVDYDYLDELWAPIASQLNYRCLNDVPGLENPTSELISSWLWARLKTALPPLSWITVYETASCGATFDGSTFRIWKEFTLDSAVRRNNAPLDNPRNAIHGYTYTLRLHLAAPLDRVMGWTVDFGDVKAIFDPIFKSIDHHPLHERHELVDGDTASIARWLFESVRHELPQLVRVDLFETAGCGSLVGTELAGPEMPL